MPMVTAESVEGKRIVRYLGIVSGEAVVGGNASRDLAAGVARLLGQHGGQRPTPVKRDRDLAQAAGTLAAAHDRLAQEHVFAKGIKQLVNDHRFEIGKARVIAGRANYQALILEVAHADVKDALRRIDPGSAAGLTNPLRN